MTSELLYVFYLGFIANAAKGESCHLFETFMSMAEAVSLFPLQDQTRNATERVVISIGLPYSSQPYPAHVDKVTKTSPDSGRHGAHSYIFLNSHKSCSHFILCAVVVPLTFQQCGSLGRTLLRGRWLSTQSARIDIEGGRAALMQCSFSNFFHACVSQNLALSHRAPDIWFDFLYPSKYVIHCMCV